MQIYKHKISIIVEILIFSNKSFSITYLIFIIYIFYYINELNA